ncbi:dihydroneopterin aldolase domain-containing protein [Sarocladium implicatum]|nr:dihydroneopterin aldolase domain-containing protein [Sarocladium implicatum]
MTEQNMQPRKKPRTTGASPPALLTHSRVLSFADDSPSIIRVRDLKLTLTGPKDAWGRLGKPQPALVSVEVRLRKPFEASSARDEVAGDTVHYGLLAKGVMGFLGGLQGGTSLVRTTGALWQHLTGMPGVGASDSTPAKAFLSMQSVAYLRVAIKLPKASLLGEGVTYSQAAVFGELEDGVIGETGVARSVRIEGLRVPTLVGVNANEREARQVVVANVDVQEMGGGLEDPYCELERVVVNDMSESSFQTLEALAQSMISALKTKYAEASWQADHPGEGDGGRGWNLGIELEKPIAVPFADAACVELRERIGI